MFWNLISNLFTQKKDRRQMEALSQLNITTETSPIVRDFSRAKRQIHRVSNNSQNN